MQYYVIGPDGNKYGPADVPTLKTWVVENRLSPDSMLEDFGTGQRVPAGSVAGLFGDGAPTATAPQPGGAPTMGAPTGTVYQNVQPMGRPQTADDGKIFIILGWIFSAIGLILCCPYMAQFSAILGTVFAFLAGSKGHPGAKALQIFAIIVLIISIAALIALFVFGASLQEWAREQQRLQGR